MCAPLHGFFYRIVSLGCFCHPCFFEQWLIKDSFTSTFVATRKMNLRRKRKYSKSNLAAEAADERVSANSVASSVDDDDLFHLDASRFCRRLQNIGFLLQEIDDENEQQYGDEQSDWIDFRNILCVSQSSKVYPMFLIILILLVVICLYLEFTWPRQFHERHSTLLHSSCGLSFNAFLENNEFLSIQQVRVW